MGVTTTFTNKPINPRGNDASPLGYNRAALYSGKALDFDGVNDSIDISNFSLNGYTAFSICFYKVSDFNNGMIFSSADSIDDGVNIYQISPGYFRARLNGVNAIDTSLKVSDINGFFVFTYDGTNAKWYYQAQNIDSGTTSQTFAITNTTTTIARQSFASVQYLNGDISGFKIFNTALTAAQVSDLYNNPEKIVPTGVEDTALKLWLPMMEGAGELAYDGSGNGNHGTINGATYVNGVGAPVAQSAVIDWNKGTNLLPYSEDFSTSAGWGGTGGTITATSNYGTAPNGTATSTRIVFTGASQIWRKTIALSQTGIWSLWIKGTAGQTIQITYGGGTDKTITLGSGWNRFNTDGNAPILNEVFINTYGGVTARDIEVWGGQVEESDALSPYVPTFGTAQSSEVLLPQGLTTGRDITGVNLFENVRKQGALNLDGNSWAEVHDNASLDLTTGLTLEAWVYFDEDVSLNGKGILAKWVGSGSSRCYMIYLDSLNRLRLYINGGSSTGIVMTGKNWYHVVGTFDQSNRKVYINGSLEATDADTSTMNASDLPLEIGTYNGLSTNAYNNDIAQPRIYNRALTAEEVLRNYNSEKNTYQ